MQVSVVIVEYHCMEQVKECVASLKEYLDAIEWECIVVSNSEYPPERLEKIGAGLNGARLIANDRNRGYAGGVNRALPECKAPYVFILNPDSRLTDFQVPALVRLLDQDAGLAAVGPKVVDSSGVVQPSCRRFPKPWTLFLVRSVFRRLPGASRERIRYLMEDFDHTEERHVDWLSGGAMLVRLAAVKDVGAMDERFFLYMEDVDWCRRFWQGGWRVRYAPVSVVCHDAQHDSIKGLIHALRSPHLRYHLVSMAKYFVKHGLSHRRGS